MENHNADSNCREGASIGVVLRSYHGLPCCKHLCLRHDCQHVLQVSKSEDAKWPPERGQDSAVRSSISILHSGLLRKDLELFDRFKRFAKLFIGMGFFLIFEIVGGIWGDSIPEQAWYVLCIYKITIMLWPIKDQVPTTGEKCL